MKKISKFVLIVAMILGGANASATLIQVEMSGFVPIDPMYSSGSVPTLGIGSTITTSFLLDTSIVNAVDVLYATYSGNGFQNEPVVSNFDLQGILTRDISLVIDGVSVGPGSGTTGATRANGLLSSPVNGTDYDMSMRLTGSDFDYNFRDFNRAAGIEGAISQASLLSSADLISALLLNYARNPAFVGLSGSFGSIAFAVDSLQIRDVPEPGTLALFGTGLLAAFAMRRRRAATA